MDVLIQLPFTSSCPSRCWSANYIKKFHLFWKFNFFLCHALHWCLGYALGFSTKMGRKKHCETMHLLCILSPWFVVLSWKDPQMPEKLTEFPFFVVSMVALLKFIFRVPAKARFNHRIWKPGYFYMFLCINVYIYQLREILNEKFSLPSKSSAFSQCSLTSVVLWGFQLQCYFLA